MPNKMIRIPYEIKITHSDLCSYGIYYSTKEVASITLRNAHKENKRAKSERSFTLFRFLNYR